MRRPSAATVIALLALFVALGGPARAAALIDGASIRKDTITTKQVKARSLSVTDLTLASSRVLQRTPPSSITAAQLRDGSVGALDLAAGSVFAEELAPGAVGGDALVTDGVGARALAAGSVRGEELLDGQVGRAEIPDGVLGGGDVGRFAGRLDLDFGTLAAGDCASTTSTSLTPVAGAQDLTDDAIVVTPRRPFPSAGLSVAAKPVGTDQIEVTVCNVDGPASLALGAQGFHYVTFDAVG